MFGKLKEKLKSWFQKSEEKAEEKIEETAKEIKELPVPEKFEVGKEKFEPDLDKIKELEIKAGKKEKEQKKPGFFTRIKEKFQFALTEEYFSSIFSELEQILLENNVALEVVEKIKSDLKKELVGTHLEKGKAQEEIKKALKISIESILEEPFDLLDKIKAKKETFVILFFGINGSGKTTTIAKIAHLLKKNNISCILAAGDTFRAASIEQLQEHGKRLQVEVIKSQYNADPASVAFDAIKHAQSKGIKAVLIDTAGRMHTKSSLLKEMEKISRVSKPDLKLFIGESITGNDVIEQAKTFNDVVGIDGIILSKADVDEKGGTSLSVSYITGKPILYLGTGQGMTDLEKFDKKKIIESLGL